MTKENITVKRPATEMSVDEILKSVRGAMESHASSMTECTDIDEDILELTNVDDESCSSNPSQCADTEFERSVQKNNSSSLVSGKSAAETTNILQNFAKTAKEIVQDSKKHKFTPLEEIVIEIVRPELSKWLDIHLPVIVRELVEQEIKNLLPDAQKK
jgi:cell pole-organizing protein PopZ